MWPLGCGSVCKHTALRTWWLRGQSDALNRKQNKIHTYVEKLNTPTCLLFYIVCNHKEICCIAFTVCFKSVTCIILIIYRNLFLQRLSLGPQTGGWLLCRFHRPEDADRKVRGQNITVSLLLFSTKLLMLNGTNVRHWVIRFYQQGLHLAPFVCLSIISISK